MAPKKQKVAATAPASRKPVVRLPGSKKAGQPTRAEKKKRNAEQYRIAQNIARSEVLNERSESARVVQANINLREVEYLPQDGLGRPWLYPRMKWSEDLGNDLFLLISTGHSMESIAEISGMPCVYQMITWLADKDHPFSSLRARAKEMLLPYFEEKAHDLTQKPTRYAIVTEKQALTRDGDIEDLVETRTVDNVERAKLAFAGLQWTLGHLMPKKHGRQPDTGGDSKNEQLEGLFAALKSGPVG